MVRFDSLNPYGTLQALTAKSPEELAALIRSVDVPIKILGSIVADGKGNFTAFILGEVTFRKIKKEKNI